jgi:hypothetical protein
MAHSQGASPPARATRAPRRYGRIPHPAIVGRIVDDDPLGPKHVQKIRIDLEKAPLTREALGCVAVYPGCPGIYRARGLDQRLEEGLSPAGYDTDLDKIYGVAKACGLRVQDHKLFPRQ